MKIINFKGLVALFSLLSLVAHAEEMSHYKPFYVGFIAGYGSTTWDGLVSKTADHDNVIFISTPVNVHEGGGIWGSTVGYEFSPYFSLEGNYIKYPQATISFQEMSMIKANYNISRFKTRTESISVLARIMLDIPKTQIRAFSGAGISDTHRTDIILNDWRLNPTFEFGLAYPLGEHFMGQLVGNYVAGFGESQLSPAETYFPFLYSLTARVAYRF